MTLVEKGKRYNKEELLEIFEEKLERLQDVSKVIKGMSSNKTNPSLVVLTPFLDNLRKKVSTGERLYCIFNDINEENFPKCVICGKPASFGSFHVGHIDVCSLNCSGKRNVENEKKKNNGKFRFQTEEFKDKSKETCLDKYGVDNVFKSHEIQQKQQETIKSLYGVDNVSQVDSIKKKKIETSRERYGTDFPWQTQEGKLRQKQGVIDKYGVENVSQLEEIKKRKEETSFENWGVRNPSQSIEVRQKILEINGFEYQLPSGEVVMIDSNIEKNLLDFLFEEFVIDDIEVQPKRSFKYFNDDGTEHYWFPDLIFSNFLCEVKEFKFLFWEENIWNQLNVETNMNKLLIVVSEDLISFLRHLPEKNNWECISGSVCDLDFLKKYNINVVEENYTLSEYIQSK